MFSLWHIMRDNLQHRPYSKKLSLHWHWPTFLSDFFSSQYVLGQREEHSASTVQPYSPGHILLEKKENENIIEYVKSSNTNVQLAYAFDALFVG